MRSYALILLLTLPIAAQQKDDTPEADPARPTVSNPAHIPPVGYLQFEQGVLQANSSPGLLRQVSVVQTTKLSLHPRLLVQVQSQPIDHTLLAPGQTTNDTGDLVFGAQVLLPGPTKAKGSRPVIALAYNGRVRAGTSPDLDLGSFAQSLAVLASGQSLGFHIDFNALINQQNDTNAASQPIRRAQYGQILAIGHDLPRNFSLTVELSHFTQPLVSADRQGNLVPRANTADLLSAGAWSPRKNVVLDAGFLKGITSTSSAWQTFTGVTYLLPHRLWPGPKAR